MERFNIDILIFLMLILSCYVRSNFLNLAIISSITLVKFYPIVSSVVFFFKGNKFSKFCFFSIFLLIISTAIYLDFDNLKKIYISRNQFQAISELSFSVYHLKNIPLLVSILNENFIIIFTLIFTSIFFIFSFYYSKKLTFLKDFNFNFYEDRLFFLGAIICITVYFAFNNMYYREIFLFFLIPYLLIKKDRNLLINYLIYFIIFRYLVFLIINYYSVNLFALYYYENSYLLIVKAFLDLFLISIIFGIFARICNNFYITYKSKFYEFF